MSQRGKALPEGLMIDVTTYYMHILGTAQVLGAREASVTVDIQPRIVLGSRNADLATAYPENCSEWKMT